MNIFKPSQKDCAAKVLVP